MADNSQADLLISQVTPFRKILIPVGVVPLAVGSYGGMRTLSEHIGTGDLKVFSFAGRGIAIANTATAVEVVLNDTTHFRKSPEAQAITMAAGGESGVLVESAPAPGEANPEARIIGRAAVAALNGEMNAQEFAAQNYIDMMQTVYALANARDKDVYKELLQSRLPKLRGDYFGESIDDAEMQLIYEHIDRVFELLLQMGGKDAAREAEGKTWYEMYPEKYIPERTVVEGIFARVVQQRMLLAAEEQGYGNDLIGFFISETLKHVDADDPRFVGMITSGFLNVFFASMDTTVALQTSVIRRLAQDPALQSKMRAAANRILQAKSGAHLDFADIAQGKGEEMVLFHRLVGRALAEEPPTAWTVRQYVKPVGESDPYPGLPDGATIFLNLKQAALGQLQDREITGYPQVADSRAFAAGPTICIGRPRAIFEGITMAIILLANTKGIELVRAGAYRERSTSAVQGLQVDITLAEG